MATFQKASLIPASADEVYRWQAREEAFERLTPPWDEIRTLSAPQSLDDGARRVMELQRGPVRPPSALAAGRG